MGVLRAIVLPQALLMTARQAQVPDSSSVGAELVGREQFRREALFLEELAHEAEGRMLVAPALNQHIENLALMIDGAPQVHPLSGNPDHHLVEVPAIARAWAAPPQLSCDPQPELQNPALHRFIGNINAALGQELLGVAVAQCEAEV
jgi:hypothetical protein